MRTKDTILLEDAYNQVGENKYKKEALEFLQRNRVALDYLPVIAGIFHEAMERSREEGDQWPVSLVADLMQNQDHLKKSILILQSIKDHLNSV